MSFVWQSKVDPSFVIGADSVVERPKQGPKPKIERDQQICADYISGIPSTKLCEKYGVSRERICQVLRRANLIELRAERKAAAKEALQEETAAIKQAVKLEFEKQISDAVEMVRQGLSIAEAGRRVGLTPNGLNILGAACKQAGVHTRYGRHRDRTEEKNLVRELRATGKTWDEIEDEMRLRGIPQIINYQWVARHMPEFINQPRTSGPKEPKQPKPEKERPPRVDPETYWTDDRVNILIEVWFKGTTALQCADILGPPCTRNAVIDKINRLRAAGKLRRPE